MAYSIYRRIGVVLLAVTALSGCGGRREKRAIPDPTQGPERVEAIRRLEPQRSGRVRVTLFARSGTQSTAAAGERDVLRFVLRRPGTIVEDTEIRGLLDGKSKYPFNQATSYHMRLGRRFDGAFDGETELKRSVVRWHLPEIPPGARLTRLRMGFWVEALSTDSPLADGRQTLPLHVYAYPLSPDWEPGQGGVGRDSFSEAAPGESSWTEARTGSVPWAAPGALGADNPGPLAVTTVERGGYELVFESGRLMGFVERCLAERRTLDVLLKLADEEEDRWGTEIALLTSEFGDQEDAFPKRPWLELEVEPPSAPIAMEQDFVVESGEEIVLPAFRSTVGESYLSVEMIGRDPSTEIPAAVFYRTETEPSLDLSWKRLHHPVRVPIGPVQLKISPVPRRIRLGDPFSVSLLQSWVSPGPREEQVPELVAIGPSGAVARVRGVAGSDLRHTMEFRPDEPGLWRYGWSSRPRWQGPTGSHQGEGVFYVLPPDPTDGGALATYVDRLALSLEGRASASAADQYRVNSFIRWAAREGIRHPERAGALRDAITRVRDVSPDRVDKR